MGAQGGGIASIYGLYDGVGQAALLHLADLLHLLIGFAVGADAHSHPGGEHLGNMGGVHIPQYFRQLFQGQVRV